MELLDKLTILADAAKYDAACTSSGLDRAGRPGGLGSTLAAGCCHSFSADGRCISLLKVLLTNRCVYDCAYCVNRRSSDVRRAAFTPRELAELTIGFYRRNYIEGLFLSSAVWGGPDRTTEAMIEALRLLRRSTASAAISTPRPSRGPTPSSPGGWACWPTACPSTSSCPARRAWAAWRPTRPRPPSWPLWPRSGMAFRPAGELARFRHAPASPRRGSPPR